MYRECNEKEGEVFDAQIPYFQDMNIQKPICNVFPDSISRRDGLCSFLQSILDFMQVACKNSGKIGEIWCFNWVGIINNSRLEA